MTAGSSRALVRLGLVVASSLVGGPAASDDARCSLTGRLGWAGAGKEFGPPGLGWRLDDTDVAASLGTRSRTAWAS